MASDGRSRQLFQLLLLYRLHLARVVDFHAVLRKPLLEGHTVGAVLRQIPSLKTRRFSVFAKRMEPIYSTFVPIGHL